MFRLSRFRSADGGAEESASNTVGAIEAHPDRPPVLRVPSHPIHRLSHSQTANSTTSFSSSPSRGGQHAPLDPLGLQTVYQPAISSGDIVFVHGLGGSAWRTWSWEREIANFWPHWLPDDLDFSSFRISTFGYNAMFKGAATNLDIIDFAKDLLLQLYTAFLSGQRDGPIIFVAHSMGGLVVKKAYMLGKYDKQYAKLIANVFGIIFLATPHRGAQYAKVLNNILSAAPFGAPPKVYVAELEKQSSSIEDMNENFRQHCEELSLVSFYETLRTNLGLHKTLIVEKDSAILGYPNEVSASMDADHHTICKFKNREDPNFLKLRGVLKSWVSRYITLMQLDHQSRKASNADMAKNVEEILGIRDAAGMEDMLIAMRSLLASGSGQWLSEKKDFVSWRDAHPPMSNLRLFWLVGLPGAGKTILSARVVEHLQSRGEEIQYHFFSQAHQTKRTSAYFLRSIATQLALGNETFRMALNKFHEETGISFNNQSQHFQAIWERIFVGIIFQIPFPQPLIWVVDGVDEADTPSLLISHFSKIRSRSPIKIYLSSRPLKGMSLFDGSQMSSYFMQGSDTRQDVRIYARNAVRDAMPDDPVLQKHVVDQILENANGSFLWVKLALETLQDSWHTLEDIEAALSNVPRGMVAMYKRMLEPINSGNPRNQELAKRILSWAACCWRPLFLDELKEALQEEFGVFTNLAATITQICGHFINIDQSIPGRPRLSLIHATAKEFLVGGGEDSRPFVDAKVAHQCIAMSCLSYLSNDRWRRHFSTIRTPARVRPGKAEDDSEPAAEEGMPFLGYASRFWAYHVSKAPTDAPLLLKSMELFFSKYCLSWIEGIALSGNMRYLYRSAKHLKMYVKRGSRRPGMNDQDGSLSLRDTQAGFDWIQAWAVDLIRIVGKFGANMIRSPASIHRHVPQFCPKESMIGKSFGISHSKALTVAGLPSETWDDCLASVNVGGEEQARQVLATDTLFLTLADSLGQVSVWSAETCEKLKTLRQGEYVFMMALNHSGALLATSGYKTICVWEISSGKRLLCIERNMDAMVRDIAFDCDNTYLLVGLDNCTVIFYSLDSGRATRAFIPRFPDNDHSYEGCPAKVAISPHINKVAMTWRGRPPLVWDLDTSTHPLPTSCRISKQDDSLLNPQQPVWQPETGSLMILCNDARLVEWRIFDDELIEYDHVNARDITVSEDGNFLLSRDNNGTISIWTFPRLNLVYSLINNNGSSTDMVFSPNSQRFYDIRGSHCNVWEPDALVRPDEYDLEDHSSSGGSFALTEAIISSVGGSQILITAMAVSSNDKYFCCGREDGSVVIADAFSGSRLRKVYSYASPVDVVRLAWSPSGKYMVSCNEYGQVIAKRLTMKEEGKWAVFPVLDAKLGELAFQFLFSRDEKLLLVSTPSHDHVWDLKAKQELHVRDWGEWQTRRWAQHPSRTDQLIWIEPSEVRIFEWATFEAVDVLSIRSPSAQGGASRKNSEKRNGKMSRSSSPSGAVRQRGVHWATTFQTGHGQYVIYATDRQGSGYHIAGSVNHQGLEVGILDAADFNPSSISLQGDTLLSPNPGEVKATVPTIRMPRALAENVRLRVGMQGQSLVFLDHEGWLCTWDVLAATGSPSPTSPVAETQFDDGALTQNSTESDDEDVVGLRRHFFMPKDWLNTNTSHLTVMNNHGALLCPKYGDVAIVRGGMQL